MQGLGPRPDGSTPSTAAAAAAAACGGACGAVWVVTVLATQALAAAVPGGTVRLRLPPVVSTPVQAVPVALCNAVGICVASEHRYPPVVAAGTWQFAAPQRRGPSPNADPNAWAAAAAADDPWRAFDRDLAFESAMMMARPTQHAGAMPPRPSSTLTWGSGASSPAARPPPPGRAAAHRSAGGAPRGGAAAAVSGQLLPLPAASGQLLRASLPSHRLASGPGASPRVQSPQRGGSPARAGARGCASPGGGRGRGRARSPRGDAGWGRDQRDGGRRQHHQQHRAWSAGGLGGRRGGRDQRDDEDEESGGGDDLRPLRDSLGSKDEGSWAGLGFMERQRRHVEQARCKVRVGFRRCCSAQVVDLGPDVWACWFMRVEPRMLTVSNKRGAERGVVVLWKSACDASRWRRWCGRSGARPASGRCRRARSASWCTSSRCALGEGLERDVSLGLAGPFCWVWCTGSRCARLRVRAGFCICLDTSAWPEPNCRAHQASACVPHQGLHHRLAQLLHRTAATAVNRLVMQVARTQPPTASACSSSSIALSLRLDSLCLCAAGMQEGQVYVPPQHRPIPHPTYRPRGPHPDAPHQQRQPTSGSPGGNGGHRRSRGSSSPGRPPPASDYGADGGGEGRARGAASSPGGAASDALAPLDGAVFTFHPQVSSSPWVRIRASSSGQGARPPPQPSMDSASCFAAASSGSLPVGRGAVGPKP